MTAGTDVLDDLRTLGLPKEDGQRFELRSTFTLRNELFQYPEFNRAIRAIARIHHRGKINSAAEGLLFVAQSGGGKSTVLNFYQSRFPPIETSTGTVIPVLRVDVPESPTVKALVETILAAMGDPASNSGSSTKKTHRIVHLFKACGVELLLLDEFQHFSDGRRPSECRHVSNWLKALMGRIKKPIVIAGLPRSILVLNQNEQLRRRFASPHYIKPFAFRTKAEQIEFRAVLNEIQELLPMECPDLSEANMARRFIYASNGLIDYVIKIVDDAASHPGSGKSGALTLEDFEDAFVRAVWCGAPKSLNPFTKSVDFRELRGPCEPFSLWDDVEKYIAPRRSRVKEASLGSRKKGDAK